MQVKEEDLRELLSPAGFVWELTVPRNPDGELLNSNICLGLPVAVEQDGSFLGYQHSLS